MNWLEDLRSLVGSVSTEILDSINEASKLSNDIMQRAIDALCKLDPKLAEKAYRNKK